MTDPKGGSWRRGAQSAQLSQQTALPKRFYKAASVGRDQNDFTLLLDGRPVRTPAKRILKVPTETLASELAAEWNGQVETINPATMPMTRLVNSALDGVTDRAAEVAEEIIRYAGGDLLFYRADQPRLLIERQAKHWDPVLAWAEKWAGGRFILAQGLMPVAQPLGTIEGVARKITGMPVLRLTATNVMTTLTGSALLALAHVNGALSLDDAWNAAHVDEDYQSELWGIDSEAASRRAARLIEMQTASRLYSIS